MPLAKLQRVEAFAGKLAGKVAASPAENLSGFDGEQKMAELEDMVEYAGKVVSAVERHRAGLGVHSWREGGRFTCMGWTRAQYPRYRAPEQRKAPKSGRKLTQRCKQAEMHWRVENAVRVCALLTRSRSTQAV